MKITHENKEYNLDIPRLLELGVLKPVPEPLRAGDVFVCPRGHTNNFLLVECLYGYLDSNPRRFQLLGMGCRANSGSFFNTQLHTIEEIREYIEKHKMNKVKNINDFISRTVTNIR